MTLGIRIVRTRWVDAPDGIDCAKAWLGEELPAICGAEYSTKPSAVFSRPVRTPLR